MLFLIAERLRNLGKFTFADVASFRLDQTSIRIISAVGTLVVVAFYLIARWSRREADPAPVRPALSLRGDHRRRPDDRLRRLRRHEGDHLGAGDQGLPAPRRRDLHGGRSAVEIRLQPEMLFANAVQVHPKGDAIMAPGGLVSNPVEAISLASA